MSYRENPHHQHTQFVVELGSSGVVMSICVGSPIMTEVVMVISVGLIDFCIYFIECFNEIESEEFWRAAISLRDANCGHERVPYLFPSFDSDCGVVEKNFYYTDVSFLKILLLEDCDKLLTIISNKGFRQVDSNACYFKTVSFCSSKEIHVGDYHVSC